MMYFKALALLSLFTATLAANYATYPQVPQTASINGFADPIYSKLPSCAQSCVTVGTGNTPCPYWDTGCLCVMPQWSGLVGECFANNCTNEDVVSATVLAESLCSSVGANTWMMPASISTDMSIAAGKYAAETAVASISASGSAAAVTVSSAASGSASSNATTAAPSSSSTLAASSSSAASNGTSSSSKADMSVTSISIISILFGTLVSFLF